MSPETQVLVDMATRSFSVSGDFERGWNFDGPSGGRATACYANVDELVFALINLSVAVEGSA